MHIYCIRRSRLKGAEYRGAVFDSANDVVTRMQEKEVSPTGVRMTRRELGRSHIMARNLSALMACLL